MENKLSFKEKLFIVKQKIEPISKDIINTFHSSKYFDINKLLNSVNSILIENRILLTQPIIDNKVYTILEDMDSDDKRESFLEMRTDIKPQDKGSEITYYRRYTLQSLLGIVAEDDDDANKTTSNKTQTKKPYLNVKKYQSDEFTKEWITTCESIKNGKIKSIKELKEVYTIGKQTEESLVKAFEKYQNI